MVALLAIVLVAPLVPAVPSGLDAAVDRLLSGGAAPTTEAASVPQWSAGGVDVDVDTSRALLSGADFDLGLQPVALGWAGTLVPVGNALDVEVSEGRSVQMFDGFEAWYVAREAGVEQGFTIAERPVGAGEMLQVVQQVSGDLLPVAAADGQGVRFVTLEGAEVASYAGLAVWDADGTVLPAHMEATEAGLVIEVDAAAAVFPVTIDPVIAEVQAKLTAQRPAGPVTSDAAPGDEFGFAVDVDGDTAVVGSHLDDDGDLDAGSVYVYTRVGTTWTVQAKLVPQLPGNPPTSDAGDDDQFGISVAIDGDTIAVGSIYDTAPDMSEVGSAYVYTRAGTEWTVQAKLGAQIPGSPPEDDSGLNGTFGMSVALEGDTLVVGRPGRSILSANRDAAYVFTRVGTVWTVQARLVDQPWSEPPTQEEFFTQHGFGGAVAISGDTIVVGDSLFDDDEAGENSGAAYVFVGGGADWTLQARLVAQLPGGVVDPDRSGEDRFGAAVAIDADTIVVGSPRDRDSRGSAYVYVRTGVDWAAQARLVAEQPGNPPTDDSEVSDEFGAAVAVVGDTVVVGSPGDDNGVFDSGSVYVYVRAGANWTLQSNFDAQPPSGSARFGAALAFDGGAVDGGTLVVGSPRDPEGADLGGASYPYLQEGNAWTVQAKLLAQRPALAVDTDDAAAGDNFGFSVAVDGETAVVGSYLDGGTLDSGSAYVYVRTGAGWRVQTQLVAQVPGNPPVVDESKLGQFGYSVAIDGDTIVVGSLLEQSGIFASPDGFAYVYVRTDNEWTVQAKLGSVGQPENQRFGWRVAVDGDTVAVGSPLEDDGGAGSGSVYVFTRAGASWTMQTKLLAQQPGNPPTADGAPGDNFGYALDISADTIVVGSADDTFDDRTGSVYVYVRAGDVWSVQAKFQADRPGGPPNDDAGTGDLFGFAVAIDGDTLVAGSPSDDDGAQDSGSAYVYVRDGTTWTVQANLGAQVPGNPPTADAGVGDQFGHAVAIDGDVVVVGSQLDDEGDENTGSAYVFTRTGTAWMVQAKLAAQQPGNPPTGDAGAGDEFGFGVAVAGDVVVVGSPMDDDGATDSGSAYVSVVGEFPSAVRDDPTVVEDTTTTIDVLENDVDLDGGSIAIDSVTQPPGATVMITNDGADLSYEPDADFCTQAAPDEFTYTLAPGGSTAVVSVNVTCVDDAPVAVADAPTVAEDDGASTIDVLVNDTDVDGGPIAIGSVTQPGGGTVVITNGGADLSYEPDADSCTAAGTDEFTYTLAPGDSIATVAVTVTCVDDAPIAVDDAATVTEGDAASTVDVLGNDTDVDDGPITVDSVTQPAGGTVVVTNGGADLSYEPDADFCLAAGTDDFTYTLAPGGSTATVAVTVTCAEDPPQPPAPDAPTVTAMAAAEGGVQVTVSNTADVPQDATFALQIVGPATFDLPDGCALVDGSIDCVIPVPANDDVVVTVGIAPTGLSPVTVTGPTGAVELPVVIGDPVSFAVQASNERFPAGNAARSGEDAGAGTAADHVVLARNDVFADALGGSVLSATGPLLFTPGDSLDARTLTEIQRVVPDGATVYLLGGPVAIGTVVADELTAAGYTIVRLEGPSRVETAVAVADQAVVLFGEPDLAGIARADSPADNPTAAWADAVAAGGWAARTRSPILLTQTDSPHPATQAWFAGRGATSPVVLGGEAAISAVTAQGLGGNRRVSGPNRFATAAAVAGELWPVDPTGYLITPGSGLNGWAYTLAAAGLAAETDRPILLTELDRLPAETDQATCTAGDRAPTQLLTPSDTTDPTIAEALSAPCL